MPGRSLVPFQIQLIVRKRCLVLGKLPLGLLQSGLVRIRVDLCEQIALFYNLALFQRYLDQLPIHAGMNGHGPTTESPCRAVPRHRRANLPRHDIAASTGMPRGPIALPRRLDGVLSLDRMRKTARQAIAAIAQKTISQTSHNHRRFFAGGPGGVWSVWRCVCDGTAPASAFVIVPTSLPPFNDIGPLRPRPSLVPSSGTPGEGWVRGIFHPVDTPHPNPLAMSTWGERNTGNSPAFVTRRKALLSTFKSCDRYRRQSPATHNADGSPAPSHPPG